MSNSLNEQQSLFVDYVVFGGMNYTDAYHSAYPDAIVTKAAGSRLAAIPKVASRIKKMVEKKGNKQASEYAKIEIFRKYGNIADAEEREEFWSGLMRDAGQRARDRLAASELLGKKQRDFVQQIESHTLTATVDLSQFSLEDLKLILAEVRQRKAIDGTGTGE